MDTGFIVYNERTYPRFIEPACGARRRDPAQRDVARLGLRRLRHRVQLARCARLLPDAGYAWLVRASGGCSWTSGRFYRAARATLDGSAAERRHPRRVARRAVATVTAFRKHFLVPITSAVWSTAADRILEFPVDYLLHFLDNHGLIGFGKGLQWRVDPRRLDERMSRRIVAALPRGLPCARGAGQWPWSAIRSASRSRTAAAASRSVRRGGHGDPRRPGAPACWVTPTIGSGGSWAPSNTRRNRVVLHTDESVLPGERPGTCLVERRARSTAASPGDALTMTYDMNRLQSIPGPVQYCVSVNPGDAIRPERVIVDRTFSHPMYTFRTLEAQAGVARPAGPASHLVRRRPPRLRVPRGRLPLRLRGGRADRDSRSEEHAA